MQQYVGWYMYVYAQVSERKIHINGAYTLLVEQNL